MGPGLEPGAYSVLAKPPQPCPKACFLCLLLIGMNTEDTIGRQQDRKDRSGGSFVRSPEGLGLPALPAAHRLVDTLDFVVMVILQDGDGNRVVIFHLQQGSLVAGSDVFHLKERHRHWLPGELSQPPAKSCHLGKQLQFNEKSQWPCPRQVIVQVPC